MSCVIKNCTLMPKKTPACSADGFLFFNELRLSYVLARFGTHYHHLVLFDE